MQYPSWSLSFQHPHLNIDGVLVLVTGFRRALPTVLTRRSVMSAALKLHYTVTMSLLVVTKVPSINGL